MRQSGSTRRAAEVLREKLVPIIMYELSDPRLEMITVTAVEVSMDRQVADVYITTDKDRYDEAMDGLKAASGRIRKLLGQALGWRVTPKLRFRIDPSVDESMRIADVLGKERQWHNSITQQH